MKRSKIFGIINMVLIGMEVEAKLESLPEPHGHAQALDSGTDVES